LAAGGEEMKIPCFFCPPHPNRIRISGWRGVFTKLEYLILNHVGVGNRNNPPTR
jgi:hypothetical protein